jgi:anti-sigma B factor antagonist
LEFALSVRVHDPDSVLITVQGDTDLHVASRLEDALIAAASMSASRIVVDLTEATLFDSSAIHALLVGRSAAGRDTEVAVVCANPSVLQVLEIAGIPELVPIHPAIPHATDGLPPAA